MEARERAVLYYKTDQSVLPFKVWRSGIADLDTLAQIDSRLARMRGGNFGDSEPIGGGAAENKIDFGPGYRIYYGVDGDTIILLCGGDKSTQKADIKKAKKYWADYKRREKFVKRRKESGKRA